jgi:PAS domain S-box-containing protein
MTPEARMRLEEAEAKASYYQSQYEFLLGQIPNPTFTVDPQRDCIVDANAAACTLLGYTRDELIGRVRLSDIHPDEMPQFLELRAQVYRDGSAHTDELNCLTAEGRSLPVRILATLVHDQQGHKLVRVIVIETLAQKAVEQALLDQVKSQYDFEEIVGKSAALDAVLEKVRQVAATDASVLIHGETGTGKELICRAIHHQSQRSDKPLVKLNCAAIPSGLVESELFGHEKGAFTGAIAQKRGRFELAHHGTIFLDEIGDISLETQPKLLRLLQEQEFERVGGTRTYHVDTRLIAATHRNLEERVKNGEFRDDLYYRLNVFPIRLPALRERREDIPLLARYFVNRVSSRYGRAPGEFSDSAVKRLCDYSWPGNVRELENVIERAFILSEGATIEERNLLLGDDSYGAHGGPVSTLRDMERRHILATLETTAWKVSGKGGAAELLGLRPTTLESRMARLGLARDRRRL